MKLKNLLLNSIITILSSLNCLAQVNLVPNPSFEDTVSLNNCGGQGVIANWNNLDSNKINNCLFLNFNSLNSGGCALPSNFWFYQNAKSGNGVIEIIVYWTAFPPQPTTIRGVPRVKLKSTLSAGKQYCAKMYVSPFETETYFTNGIGMYFDNGQLDTIVAQDSSGIYPFVNPQVQCGFIIDDTLNWKVVEGVFTATGNETFLTIANFLSDVNTQKTYCVAANPCSCSDIIIDDVSLIETDISDWLQDVYCVLGDSVYIGLPKYEVPDAQWYDINMTYLGKGSGIKVKPTQWATQYIQAIDVCSTIRYDTMTVWSAPLGVNLIPELEGEGLKVFPNPVNDKLFISSKGKENRELYDSVGKLIFSTKEKEIDVSKYARGIYYLKCGGSVKKVVIK